MRDLLRKRIKEVEEAEASQKNYYGSKVCGACMFWESEDWRNFPGHCTYREERRQGSPDIKFGPGEGREPNEELFYNTDAENCLMWFD